MKRLKSKVTSKEISELQVGDIIKFRTATVHSGNVLATRKIVQIHDSWGFGVRMFGCTPYWLNLALDQIIEIQKGENNG